MRRACITATLSLLLGACSGGAAVVPDGGRLTSDAADGGRCVGDLATVGQGCAPMFDGTAANLPACRWSNAGARQVVWLCQDLIMLADSHGLGGAVCTYDTTSHVLVGAEQISDIGVFCDQTSVTIEAGRTNPMCRENAPATERSCGAPDGGAG